MDASFIVTGFIVGALVGLTGMGGGSLMTPLLILVFGVHPVSAVRWIAQTPWLSSWSLNSLP